MALVHAVMTPAAARFVSPLTVAAASGTRVWTDIFADAALDPLAHIHLARMAEFVLVAPASFDFIGKIAAGLANDPVSLLIAATTAPVLFAPAMHDTMWKNPIVQANMSALKDVGYRFIPPETGLQATGEVGEGRMAGINATLSALLTLVKDYSNDSES